MAGQPKPAFYAAVIVVIAALVGFAIYRSDIFAPGGGQAAPAGNAGNAANPGNAGGGAAADQRIDPGQLATAAEAPDAKGVTTVEEYKFKPGERLPEVKGTAAYSPMKDNTVRFALNVWAGWAPIIFANNGFQPGKVWKTPDGEEFKVELVLIDNPVAMRDAYAAGEVHIGWATVDMLPLFMEGFVDRAGKPRDSRVMPRVYQQVDWSNGGDGIVVRDTVKTVADLRGKKIVLAQNSPSHYFALNMIVSGGLQPGDLEWAFTEDAFQAAAAFNSQKDIAACVSWAPDIYNLSEVRGNRMLVNTQTANKLIADVWFARADFATEHPGIVEGVVRGIFDAMTDLKSEDNQKKCADLMGAGYNLPPAEALKMLGDAHSTNWAENYQFLLNKNNPANFERVWNQAYFLYGRIRAVTHQRVPFDQVVDASVIQKLGKEEKYSSQKNEYEAKFTPKAPSQIKGEADEVLTNTVIIHFYPNSWDIEKKVTKDEGGKTVEALYDPNTPLVLEEIAQLAGRFGAARIIIEGHTDSSMRGQVPADVVKELSLNRANAVKEALVRKYELDPNKFSVEGVGWDKPADPADPNNQAKNRRVEVRVFSAEREA